MMAGLSGDDLRVGLRFLAALPRFLRSPFSLEQARAEVRQRFEQRPARFLESVTEACRVPDSPYAKLLQHVGCTLPDLRNSVAREGVEGALQELLRAGVSLSGDEFKSRRPMIAAASNLLLTRLTLLNPRSVVHGLSECSGNRGARTPVPVDLAFIHDHAVNTHLTLAAHGGRDWQHAHYGAPGGTAVTNPLEFARGGRPPVRWFTPVDPAMPGLDARYRLGASAMRIGSLLAGVPLPAATLAPLEAPLPIAPGLPMNSRVAASPTCGRLPVQRADLPGCERCRAGYPRSTIYCWWRTHYRRASCGG